MSESSTGAGNAAAAALVPSTVITSTGSSFAFKSIMAMEIIRFLRFINVLYYENIYIFFSWPLCSVIMKIYITFYKNIFNNTLNNSILDKLSS